MTGKEWIILKLLVSKGVLKMGKLYTVLCEAISGKQILFPSGAHQSVFPIVYIKSLKVLKA